MKARVIAALIAIPIVLFVITSTYSLLFTVLIIFLTLSSLNELRDIICKKASDTKTYTTLFYILPLILLPLAIVTLRLSKEKLQYIDPQYLLLIPWVLFIAGLTGLAMIIRKKTNPFSAALSSLWIISPAILMRWAYEYFNRDPSKIFVLSPLLLVFIPIWTGDIAAIFVGKKYGKRHFLPTISPHKTLEGALANFLACILSALLLGLFLNIGFIISLLCGLFAGIFGQLGDLVESKLKRSVEIKDSGKFLPGHGGVLDRIDSLLFNIMFTCTLLISTLPPIKPIIKTLPSSNVSRETFSTTHCQNNSVSL